MSGATSVKKTRTKDWLPNLVKYVTETASEPFAWGSNDCGYSVSRAVEAMTGWNPIKEIGSYTDYKGAIRNLRKLGYKDHIDFVAKNFKEVPVSFATVGDIVVVDTEDGPALGLVQGEYIYVTTHRGRGLVPLLDAKRAFEVPWPS